jgi:pimeloyl-ACP methyl ester carboxylesterase
MRERKEGSTVQGRRRTFLKLLTGAGVAGTLGLVPKPAAAQTKPDAEGGTRMSPAFKYRRLSKDDAAVLLVDHQSGLISAVPPLMLKTAANPGGLPIDVFDQLRAASIADRSQLYKDLASGPVFGFNRLGAMVSQGMIDWFWRQGMQAGHKNALDCIKAFSETDFTEDLKKFDVPTLILHGDDDQIVPIGASALASAKLVKHATLKVYPGAPHGLTDTHKDQLNADLLAFLKAEGRCAGAASPVVPAAVAPVSRTPGQWQAM